MRIHHFNILVTSITLLCTAPLARAQFASERSDRATFNRLVEQVRRLDADYAKALNQAAEEAREGDGSASGDAQARLLTLRDQRDRVMDRLLLLSVRHGWDIPEPNSTGDAGAEPVMTEKDRIFEGASAAVRGRLAQEAAAIARTVRLPVVPLSSLRNEED